MRNSGISSATQAPPPPGGPTASGASPPTREHVALTGRSVTLDPRCHAVRPDLADVRLAAQVFAPHYAAPVARTVTTVTALRAARAAGSAVLATLQTGASFELLDLLGDDAWGVAPDEQLVGYLDAGALAEPVR